MIVIYGESSRESDFFFIPPFFNVGAEPLLSQAINCIDTWDFLCTLTRKLYLVELEPFSLLCSIMINGLMKGRTSIIRQLLASVLTKSVGCSVLLGSLDS